MIKIFKVEGVSMEPSYRSGDIVFCLSTNKIKKNDVIAFETEKYGLVLKRINSLDSGKFKVTSDNHSYDSPILKKEHEVEDIVGKVLFSLNSLKSFLNPLS